MYLHLKRKWSNCEYFSQDWFDFEAASEDDTGPVFLKMERSNEHESGNVNSKDKLIEEFETNNETLKNDQLEDESVQLEESA